MDSFEKKFTFSINFDEAESDRDRLKKCIDQLLEKPVIIIDTKSTNNAMMYNSMAMIAMMQKNYDEAINFYTKGLQEVFPYCDISAILYSNRAKAFECLGMYEEGLIDIDKAIEISPNTEITKQFLDIKRSLFNQRLTSTGLCDNKTNVKIIETLDMHNAVRLVHCTKYGVNFEAAKPISAGDTILIEKPQVTSILQPNVAVANVCYYCLKLYKALIPCERCNGALYCSKECRAKASEEYHRGQCNSKNFPDDVQFVMNLLMKITENGEKLTEAIQYCEMLDTMSASNDSMHEYNTKCDNLGNNLKSVLNLSISMKENDEKNTKNTLKSAYIALFLQDRTSYMQECDVLSIAKLLFRLFYIFHAHALLNYISVDSKTAIGVYNLYSKLSLIHHSCCANTYSIYENGMIAVYAAKDIQPGEQITFNFLRSNDKSSDEK